MAEETPAPADSTTAFAADLRALRLRAESPTLEKLQRDSGISRSVLSSAFAGRHLPSARTVDRTVRALGEDASPWVARRDAIARSTGADATPPEAPVAATSGAAIAAGPAAPGRSRTVSRRRAAALAAVAFVAGFAVAIGASWIAGRSIVQQVRAAAADAAQDAAASALGASSPAGAQDGDDPHGASCDEDARVLASEERAGDTTLEILWSDACGAGWARLTRAASGDEGDALTVEIRTENAAQHQAATVTDARSVSTPILVRPDAETLLCASGAVDSGGASTALGSPLCA